MGFGTAKANFFLKKKKCIPPYVCHQAAFQHHFQHHSVLICISDPLPVNLTSTSRLKSNTTSRVSTFVHYFRQMQYALTTSQGTKRVVFSLKQNSQHNESFHIVDELANFSGLCLHLFSNNWTKVRTGVCSCIYFKFFGTLNKFFFPGKINNNHHSWKTGIAKHYEVGWRLGRDPWKLLQFHK